MIDDILNRMESHFGKDVFYEAFTVGCMAFFLTILYRYHNPSNRTVIEALPTGDEEESVDERGLTT